MDYPDDLYYNRDHIWLRIQGPRGTIGVSDFAQREMGEILFVDLPEEGSQVEKDDVPSAVRLFPPTRTWRRNLPWSTMILTGRDGSWWWRWTIPRSWRR
jgi:hypothetical protein